MKLPHLLVIVWLCAVMCHAAPPVIGTPPAITNVPANYVIRVEWKDAKKSVNSLQLVTGEGTFELDTISGSAKIDAREIPVTVKLSGTLTTLNPGQGRLQLFLGRTVPYVTGTFAGSGGGASSSYSQMQVGLQSTFVVTYGKPLVIQADANGEVSILVMREEQ